MPFEAHKSNPLASTAFDSSTGVTKLLQSCVPAGIHLKMYSAKNFASISDLIVRFRVERKSAPPGAVNCADVVKMTLNFSHARLPLD